MAIVFSGSPDRDCSDDDQPRLFPPGPTGRRTRSGSTCKKTARRFKSLPLESRTYYRQRGVEDSALGSMTAAVLAGSVKEEAVPKVL